MSRSIFINEQINPSKDGSRAQAVNDLAEIILIKIVFFSANKINYKTKVLITFKMLFIPFFQYNSIILIKILNTL